MGGSSDQYQSQANATLSPINTWSLPLCVSQKLLKLFHPSPHSPCSPPPPPAYTRLHKNILNVGPKSFSPGEDRETIGSCSGAHGLIISWGYIIIQTRAGEGSVELSSAHTPFSTTTHTQSPESKPVLTQPKHTMWLGSLGGGGTWILLL